MVGVQDKLYVLSDLSGRAVNWDLSTTSVKRLVKSAAKAAGLERGVIDTFSGHSLRVGAAQDLLCEGMTQQRPCEQGLEVGQYF